MKKHIAVIACLAWLAACGGDDEELPGSDALAADAADELDAAPGDDAAPPDDAAPEDAGPPVDASVIDAGTPTLACTPERETVEDLCTCMANIVCDQIYACLDSAEIESRPGWSPHATCVEGLEEDCIEDSSDGTDNLPTDFPACVTDIGAATCGDFGDFASVSDDFPASCDNLRALDTALGITP
jgi:hypothetical protein